MEEIESAVTHLYRD